MQAGRAFQASSLSAKNITSATLISVTQTNVSLNNTMFSELVGQVFVSTESTFLSIRNSSLSNVNARKSTLIFCTETQIVKLHGVSVFTVRTDQMSVYLETSEVLIEGCRFQEVLGGKYGALFIKNSTLSLSGSFFLSNRALASNSQGGALSLSNTYAVITNCTFISNSAYIGALYTGALDHHNYKKCFYSEQGILRSNAGL